MRHLALAFAGSLAVCLATMYVNYQSYQETQDLEWSLRRDGGEITVETAPGWHAVHIYAMTPEQRGSHKLEFAPVSLAISVLVGTGAVYGVLLLVDRFR